MQYSVTFDIEYNPETDTLNSLGVFIPSTGWAHKSTGKPAALQDAVRIINSECQELQYVVGHNIIAHDIKELRKKAPDIILCRLPAIDTLYLSPLAFPQNPYHRLVKGYKLVKDAVNDPVADAKLSWELLQDCMKSFSEMDVRYPRFYGFILSSAFPEQGFGPLFESIVGGPLPTREEAEKIWIELASESGCPKHARDEFFNAMDSPERMLCPAYALAWLSVSGGNSVVPAWVRHRMPEISPMLDRLRGRSCDDPECVFCAKHHDIHSKLGVYFGFDSFRPVKEENPPIQEAVVRSITAGHHCLAVLPTGAGKSLCYQLPALMRAEQRNLLTLIISPLQSLMKD